MTNLDYVIHQIGTFGADETDATIILVKANIDKDDPCDSAEAMKKCDEAIYESISVILKGASKNVSEGGFSLSWNIDILKDYYNSLCKELGKPNTAFSKPKLVNKSNIW